MKKISILLLTITLLIPLVLSSCYLEKGPDFSHLLAVMPEGAEFDTSCCIYSIENASDSDLKNVPSSIQFVYKEKNGLGFVIRVVSTNTFDGAPLVLTIGINPDGTVCGINVDNYDSSYSESVFTNEYIEKYIGNGPSLTGIELINGATISSRAFRYAVSEAINVIISNGLINANTDFLTLESLIPNVYNYHSFLSEVNAIGINMHKAFKSKGDTGFVYIMTEGESSYLVLVNAMGGCQIYDVNGKLVENETIATEAKAYASASGKSYTIDLINKVDELVNGATNYTTLTLDAMNSIVSAITFQVDGETYYAFYSIGYGYELIDICVILDASGAIVKVDAQELIHGEDFMLDYFDDYTGVPGGYMDGFIGESSNTWTGNEALIAGSTITSNAMKTAVNDAFDAFDSLTKK